MSVIAGLLMSGLLVTQGVDISPATIGDSYASGTGAGQYSNELCMRSGRAAIDDVADFFGSEAVNGACNGAWVKDLTEPRMIARSRTDVELEGNTGDLAAFHRHLIECGQGLAGASTTLEFDGNGETVGVVCAVTLDPQVDASSGRTDIFITIGGNDIGFVPVAGACLINEDEELCREAIASSRDALAPMLESQRDAVDVIRRSEPDARIHLVPYPRLLAEDSDALVGEYDVADDLNDLQASWEEDLRSLADDVDGHFVETVTPIWAGHGLGSSESWIHTTGNIGELLHPTEDGWRATGTAYIAHLGNVAMTEH